jgi:hypothetical protein
MNIVSLTERRESKKKEIAYTRTITLDYDSDGNLIGTNYDLKDEENTPSGMYQLVQDLIKVTHWLGFRRNNPQAHANRYSSEAAHPFLWMTVHIFKEDDSTSSIVKVLVEDEFADMGRRRDVRMAFIQARMLFENICDKVKKRREK